MPKLLSFKTSQVFYNQVFHLLGSSQIRFKYFKQKVVAARDKLQKADQSQVLRLKNQTSCKALQELLLQTGLSNVDGQHPLE